MLANVSVNNVSVTLWTYGSVFNAVAKTKCLYVLSSLRVSASSIDRPMPCKTLFCLFLLTCVLQSVCVYTKDFASGH